MRLCNGVCEDTSYPFYEGRDVLVSSIPDVKDTKVIFVAKQIELDVVRCNPETRQQVEWVFRLCCDAFVNLLRVSKVVHPLYANMYIHETEPKEFCEYMTNLFHFISIGEHSDVVACESMSSYDIANPVHIKKSASLDAMTHVAQTHNTKFFVGTKILGTMPTLGDTHSSDFAGHIVSNVCNHPPPMGSVASDIGSVFPDRSVGALHPTVVGILQPFSGSIASNIGSAFGADFWVRTPGVRCAPYLGTIIQ